MTRNELSRACVVSLCFFLIATVALSLVSCASGGVDSSSAVAPVERTSDGFIKVSATNEAAQVSSKVDLDRGQMDLDWSRMQAVLAEHGAQFQNLDVSLLIDGVDERPMAKGATRYHIEFAKPGEQHDAIVIFRDPKSHKSVHESNYILLEALKSQTVDPKTFEAFMGDHAFSVSLPAAFDQSSSIDPALVRKTIDIGYTKVVWTLTSKATSATMALALKYGLGLRVLGHLDRTGMPLSFRLYAPTGELLGDAQASEIRLQNDAAFNGNAFFWDNQFVSLAALIHHPSLAASTLDFHYDSQDLVGNGVIPREVRHSKRCQLSSLFPSSVRS